MEKKPRIAVSTNIYFIDPLVYASHLSAFYRMGKNVKDYDLVFIGRWRMPIDQARNYAAINAMSTECKYLIFYDDDMFLDPDLAEKLIKRMEETKASIVTGKCYIRGHPYEPMIFRFINEKRNQLTRFDYKPEDVDERGLVKIDACGCACTIIDVDLFKELREPFFLTGEMHTEDVYFCMKLIENYGYDNINIYMDDKFECGHLLDKRILNSSSRQNLIDDFKRGYDVFGLPIEKELREQQDLDFLNENPLLKEKENVA
jgi:hypothetical protein